MVDIKQLPYYENINYNESNIIKKMEQDSDNFVMDIKIRKKSAFMLLSFQDRVINSEITLEKKSTRSLACRKKKNMTSEDLQNSSASSKKTILQYSRKRGLHEVSR